MNGTPPRRKGLPPRPSADLGYGGRGRQDSYEVPDGRDDQLPAKNYSSSRMNPQAQDPPARVVLGGYKADIMNGFEGETPRYNPMNAARPQSSMLLDLNDSIQVHMLVETALGDSKELEILSEGEVDDLKKQCKTLSQRIEQTRQNLMIQSKYRDATKSMSRLYASESKPSPSDTSEHEQANQERLASEKKCEDLASELWMLEKRLMEPQMRLLKHTAGILQMTHKGPKMMSKGAPGRPSVGPSGIPGSPESMYTYSNARNSFEPLPGDDLIFDERSLYRSFNQLDELGESGGESSFPASKEQMDMITKTEQRLEDLNSRLREVIIQNNPQQEEKYGLPPLNRSNGDSAREPGRALQSSLDYLEQGIDAIGREHGEVLDRFDMSQGQMEETLEELNRELHGLLQPYDEIRPEPPQLTGRGLNDQLSYLQNNVTAVQAELARSMNLSSKSNGNQDQMETVMIGLWEIILSGEEEARQRKLERKQNRSMNNLPDDDDDMSSDEGDDPPGPFSLQSFSAKVQWLYSQATKLKDQKKVLQRQIKQQRELNNKSDATKDAEITQKSEELTRTQELLNRTERDADTVREQLGLVMQKLDEVREEKQLRDQARSKDESAAVRAAQEELNNANSSLAALEEELQDLKDDYQISNAEMQTRLSDSETKITHLTQELAVAASAQAAFETSVKEKEKEIEAKELEMENMNMELARLQTEVTIARAELDGAYGSRAQRAAEVAANPAIQKEIDDLTRKNASLAEEITALKTKGTVSTEAEDKMRTLKKELEETIEEYEQMTKASIEWEKDREQLEGVIDKLRDEREQMEAQLSDEKVRWLGMKSPGVDGAVPGPGSTSTTVLKNEFKKMMRDTRAENAKSLRAEQAERRKLEDELRALKRAQGPGKSSLSQSIGSS
ncbi:Uncharacterized protein BP5553_01166 [Venustampulla echinocandica]|uniref:Uncharacterized protein n=1 Tax=Venustampulla echinocandica TaxID=2656787 RepID=A0A370U093_9HELO|nr:Uncharacterized protein BP5553_01166 [Venustampulla echinocandica]RDL41187.1 Uncharacterized protein BP5553_01166 [Venustampulla echinocandica]